MNTSLISPGLLVNLNRCKHRHCLERDLCRQWLVRFAKFRQELEVVDVERRSRRKEDPGFLIGRIAEGVRCSNWYDHIVTGLGIHDALIVTWPVRVRDVKAN